MSLRRRFTIFGISTIVLVLTAICGFDAYRSTRWSAQTYLTRMAGLPDGYVSLEDARSSLLHHLPKGTPVSTVISFLEKQGVEQDQFVGGQFMRYQIQREGRTILGLLSDPPRLISFPCTGTGYIIHFGFDVVGLLNDIVVQSSEVCL